MLSALLFHATAFLRKASEFLFGSVGASGSLHSNPWAPVGGLGFSLPYIFILTDF